jgi:hypothetical protein
MKKIHIVIAACVIGLVLSSGCTDISGIMPTIPKMNIALQPSHTTITDPNAPAPTATPVPTVVFPIPTPSPTSQFVFV